LETHKKNAMEAKFKPGDVVVQNDINVSMFKMTVETFIVPFVEGNEWFQYKCAFFELGKLYKEWFREDQLLFEHEFIQKRICENRNSKIEKILREV
jgi:hypothetical protein